MLAALRLPGRLVKGVTNDWQRGEGERPELWAAPIEARFVATGKAAREDASCDLESLVREWEYGARIQAQRDELRLLIRQHYLSRLTAEQMQAFWAIPQGVAARWREMGVLGPVTLAEPLQNITAEMAEASRLAGILNHGHTYGQMRRMAQQTNELDADKLALHIANETMATAIERMSSRHGDSLADMASMEQRRYLLSILGHVGIDGRGRNIRLRLARDLAGLLKADDVGREWERAAVTTTRYAYNLGVLSRLRMMNVTWIVYNVHPDACPSCKRLLLYPDGTPRTFPLLRMWQQIAEDGGLNIGRKASRIGHDDGWRACVVLHPYCRCVPRKAKKYEIRNAANRMQED